MYNNIVGRFNSQKSLFYGNSQESRSGFLVGYNLFPSILLPLWVEKAKTTCMIIHIT
jgi:hypothetical protein